MKTPFKNLSLPFLLLTLACSPQKEQPKASLMEERLDSIFHAIPDFSGVLLVAAEGKPVYHKAFGFRSFERQENLDTASVFELASVSKQFTAMIIMMLKEEGLLNYDEPVAKYIPGLPYPGITIRHLLNHTSGLPDYQAVMDEHWDKSNVAGNPDNIEYLKKYHPEKRFAAGDKYEYSNTGYMLLASIAENVTGKNFRDLCRERIFSPLGMHDTDIRSREEKAALDRMAWGHLYVAEKHRYIQADSFPEFNYAIWLGKRFGPGRISSTTADLLKWDQALYSNRLVKQETLLEAFTPATLNNGTKSDYGFGWILDGKASFGKIVSHTGDNPGYKTIIVRYVDQNVTVILLCNNAHSRYDEVAQSVADSLSDSGFLISD